jgi:hypothetical protein
MVGLQVGEHQLTHVALTGAVAQQQHHIGLLHRRNNAAEVGVIQGSPLAGDVTVVAVREVFATAP